ncbi:hypothetical protein RZ761_17670 [Klebsiella pasteurii]|uniref:Uncharacterized protein n=1 Tax=Klebsiella pasteurii TaxID=2587529 RepID=A0ABT5CTG5_9ENTR|nr:hypothetical protein [Klebsiella pasteurii]MDC0694820.1 hypothetical protein [Klebsiella pasteurii]MDC0757172.1 hypothetical protein [Klebsiella pasteurii]MDQ2169871.1 hypothetical protein [Klebsiella pasteurii]MDQ2202320.1 hypothetical protein [Klebsiella pasteurii]MDQ2226053.1 hypothetical protein [Klebsiella pasteurii]
MLKRSADLSLSAGFARLTQRFAGLQVHNLLRSDSPGKVFMLWSVIPGQTRQAPSPGIN